jgi:hypothetical protein
MEGGRCTVRLSDAGRAEGAEPVELGVSRRHTRELRELLLRRAGGS